MLESEKAVKNTKAKVDNSNIYKKMLNIMNNMSRVPKNGYNSYNKYKYVKEEDLVDYIRPLLVENGLAFTSNMVEQERNEDFTKVKMEFTLVDVDTQETLTSIYWGEGQDKQDKGIYKAVTGAEKYFLMKTFLVATGDDPEEDTKDVQPQGKGKHDNSKNKSDDGKVKIKIIESTINKELQKTLFESAKGNNDIVKTSIEKEGYKTTAEIPVSKYKVILDNIKSQVEALG